jgi:hypothetical protein
MHKPQALPCPCGGSRVHIGGVGWRCSQCGAVFANAMDKDPLSVIRTEPCCGSPLLVTIAGGKRCQQCGWQSNLLTQPKGIGRKDIGNYTGGRARMNSPSFFRALARTFGGRK